MLQQQKVDAFMAEIHDILEAARVQLGAVTFTASDGGVVMTLTDTQQREIVAQPMTAAEARELRAELDAAIGAAGV